MMKCNLTPEDIKREIEAADASDDICGAILWLQYLGVLPL